MCSTLFLVADARDGVVVEVRAAGAHAADVQRQHRPHEVGGGVDVVRDDDRHEAGDLEVLLVAVRAGLAKPSSSASL